MGETLNPSFDTSTDAKVDARKTPQKATGMAPQNPPLTSSKKIEGPKPNYESDSKAPSFVQNLLGGMRPSAGSSAHFEAISTIDAHCRVFSTWVMCTWILLVATVYVMVPRENFIRLTGTERHGAMMGMCLLAISVMLRVFPQVVGNSKKKNRTNVSGIFIGALCIQTVAFFTDFLMAFAPTPVLIDPVLGTRVHVLRWCEWFPAGSLMSFMMEGADLYWTKKDPPPDFIRGKYIFSTTQGTAIFLGLLLPFCPGFWSWNACFGVAMVLHSTIYFRTLKRRGEIPMFLKPDATVEETERFNTAKLSLRLRYICTIVWACNVILYCAADIYGPLYAAEESWLRNPSANMLAECFFDVIAKVLFLVVIVDVHYAIFDPYARTERRLEELRQLMSAVWESSSDVIAISVRSGAMGGASTMLSPAFFSLGSNSGPLRRLSNQQIQDLFRRKSVIFQLRDEAFRTPKSDSDFTDGDNHFVSSDMICDVDYTGFSSFEHEEGKLVFNGGAKTETGGLQAIADVIVKAWASEQRELVFSRDLKWKRVRDDREIFIQCEAKVCRLDENSLIVIVRDISERVRVFEAEKQILFETTSRQKDAEANRFTRHEVKNGLLAAIGLYESLCEAQRNQLSTQNKLGNNDLPMNSIETDFSEDVIRCMNELGKSLQETLDTVLVEAMSRDLVHDLYRPHKERIDIASVLSGFADTQAYESGSAGNLTRFPLIARPSPLPLFHFDPQLIRYLHRQALSNACKYGKTGAVVLTEIIYDGSQGVLQVNVINLPGEHHEKLIAMGSSAEEAVFMRGSVLHERFRNDTESVATKSEVTSLPGNGGWIMRKCAKILKGTCTIKFEKSRTVFSLNMPALPFGMKKLRTPVDVKNFSLPNDIWGIAIDDSKIQQKLLAKFFEFAGIASNRIKVFGKNSDEITGFVDFVVNFMDEHMGEQVLLIADENLDVIDGASHHITISGSELVMNIRSRLLPEQERHLVALIRSANDSSSDVAIYKARAHGFLPKAPIKKGNVLETLAPLWYARYPSVDDLAEDQSHLTRSDSMSSIESSSSLNEAVATSPLEIMQTVNEIDDLFQKRHVHDDWQQIWEKLHALKGDLLTLRVGSTVIAIVGMINSFRDLRSDDEKISMWSLLRERISALVSSC